MPVCPAQKESPGIGKKPTATEKAGRRESQGTGEKGWAHLLAYLWRRQRGGKAAKGKDTREGPKHGTSVRSADAHSGMTERRNRRMGSSKYF